MHPFLKPLAALAALALAGPGAHAGWEIPAGGAAQLGGGTVSLGCASVSNGGALQLDGGALLAARDVRTHAGALLAVGAGRVELAQQWAADGSVTLTTGRVERKDGGPGCPAVGALGQLLPATAPPAPQPVAIPPAPGGGAPATAQVGLAALGVDGTTATALPPGCAVTQLAIDRVIPPDTPANARFPLGALRFEAQGCPGVVMQVSVTYPPGSLQGLALQKYGPHGTGAARRTGWFTPPGLQVSGDTARYTVADGGDGDGDARSGYITDPFAPMLLAAPGPGGAQAIPTLGEWALAALSILTALLGARRLRRPF